MQHPKYRKQVLPHEVGSLTYQLITTYGAICFKVLENWRQQLLRCVGTKS